MSKFRIKTDEEQTCFYLDYPAGTVRIGACKGQCDAILARICPDIGTLQLNSCREEVFMELGIDYKKRDSGGGYVWNVEE